MNTNVDNSVTENSNTNKVDIDKFQKCFNNLDIEGIYECLKGKSDDEQYKPYLKEVINDKLWNIIETSGKEESEKQCALSEYRIQHRDVFEYINFTDKDFEKWHENIVLDYIKMRKILEKLQISEREYKTALKILNEYSSRYDSGLKDTLKSKKKNTTEKSASEVKSVGMANLLIISYTDGNGKNIVDSLSIKKDRETKTIYVQQKEGQKAYVKINFSGGEIIAKDSSSKSPVVKKKNEVKIEAKESRIIYCGNFEITIRIKVKSNFKSA